ncbi:MAG: hypothetical protein K0B07_00310 [DPANN group archaeon]|nr:hypothetical protein [DPANN group archaeon]
MKRQNLMKLFALLVAAMYMVVPAAFAEDAVTMLTNTAINTAVGDDVADLNDIAVQSDEEDSAEAGVTPDSPLYRLDVAMDNIGLMFTFNKAKKAEKKLEIAKERLKEAKMMAIANNLDAMEKAKNRHDAMLLSAEEDIEAINGNETKALMSNIRIKSMLKLHNQEVADVEQELTLRVRGNLKDKQQEKLDSFIESMKGSSKSIEVKVQNKEEKMKAVVKRTRNLSDDDVDAEFEKINRETLREHMSVKALDVIGQAEDAIGRAEDLIEKKSEAGKDVTYSIEQLDEAKIILLKAKESLDNDDVEDSIEQAFKAKRMAVYAASGFSVEKLMNTPMKDNVEFNEMKEQIRENMEERVQVRENIREPKEEMMRNRENIREPMKDNKGDKDVDSDDDFDDDSDDENSNNSSNISLNASVSGTDNSMSGSVSGNIGSKNSGQ